VAAPKRKTWGIARPTFEAFFANSLPHAALASTFLRDNTHCQGLAALAGRNGQRKRTKAEGLVGLSLASSPGSRFENSKIIGTVPSPTNT